MPDFECLHRSFQTSYLTYYAERSRCRAQFLLWRAQFQTRLSHGFSPTVQAVQRSQIRCDGCRQSRHSRMLDPARRVATLLYLLHHCPATAANQRHMHGAACQAATRPPPTTGPRNKAWFAQLFLRFHSVAYSMAYSMAFSILRGIAISHLSALYSRGAR